MTVWRHLDHVRARYTKTTDDIEDDFVFEPFNTPERLEEHSETCLDTESPVATVESGGYLRYNARPIHSPQEQTKGEGNVIFVVC